MQSNIFQKVLKYQTFLESYYSVTLVTNMNVESDTKHHKFCEVWQSKLLHKAITIFLKKHPAQSYTFEI